MGFHVPGLFTFCYLPRYFGFDLGTAFAWTAYFETAPEIRTRYYGEAEGKGIVDVF